MPGLVSNWAIIALIARSEEEAAGAARVVYVSDLWI